MTDLALLAHLLQDRRAVFDLEEEAFNVQNLCPDSHIADIIGSFFGCKSVWHLPLAVGNFSEHLRDTVPSAFGSCRKIAESEKVSV